MTPALARAARAILSTDERDALSRMYNRSKTVGRCDPSR